MPLWAPNSREKWPRDGGRRDDKTTPGTLLVGVKEPRRKQDGQWLVTDAEGAPVTPGQGQE